MGPRHVGSCDASFLDRVYVHEQRHDRLLVLIIGPTFGPASREPSAISRGHRWMSPDWAASRARRAAATAAERFVSPSLRRTAETWWSTVFGRHEEPCGHLCVGEPLGEQGQHLELPRGEPGGVPPGLLLADRAAPVSPASCRSRSRARRVASAPMRPELLARLPGVVQRTPSGRGSPPATTGSPRVPTPRQPPPSRPRASAGRAPRSRRPPGPRRPRRCSHQDSSPLSMAVKIWCSTSRATASSRAIASRSPRTQAASALASATGTMRWASPVAAARSRASSSRTSDRGSARRTATVPATTSAGIRLTGDWPRSSQHLLRQP